MKLAWALDQHCQGALGLPDVTSGLVVNNPLTAVNCPVQMVYSILKRILSSHPDSLAYSVQKLEGLGDHLDGDLGVVTWRVSFRLSSCRLLRIG